MLLVRVVFVFEGRNSTAARISCLHYLSPGQLTGTGPVCGTLLLKGGLLPNWCTGSTAWLPIVLLLGPGFLLILAYPPGTLQPTP